MNQDLFKFKQLNNFFAYVEGPWIVLINPIRRILTVLRIGWVCFQYPAMVAKRLEKFYRHRGQRRYDSSFLDRLVDGIQIEVMRWIRIKVSNGFKCAFGSTFIVVVFVRWFGGHRFVGHGRLSIFGFTFSGHSWC